ncbi:protein phosphatase pp2a regulatory subunit b [Anaeramoeba flamelloides]|uniref:Serine/threonine-protein phosphatase 2A 55 kDa regulatory subunit B n=1 Tax=Anaeramoeba flamelloides TaxID=1746091 RepID=A0AAV7ZDJ2_9EUKA|nr:protein phosphatase pp2a regulatory subunit b [Anaeramoeba flamelloides]KAJ6247999.1 protein phosphatase pp2a regulatory subunit b [Anaeramoeba flamelloides]
MEGVPFKWRVSQIFGDKSSIEKIAEQDKISALEFDSTGNYVAVGDRGGRVILFQSNRISNESDEESDLEEEEFFKEEKEEEDEEEENSKKKKGLQYKFYTEFQSHEPEFDYLKSIDIEEKINKIQWIKRRNRSHLLLSTNDQTIKLWKIFSKETELVTELNIDQEEIEGINSPKDLIFPKTQVEEINKEAYNKRTYGNAHAYNINAISLCSDDEVFISSDELRINLWHLERTDKSFNIVDLKPDDLEQLSEVITCSQFHPSESSQFMYSLSKGIIHLGDLRQSAKCNNSVRSFEDEETSVNDSFFTEIMSNIADIKYSPCGRYILSRDYSTLKVWDVKMESKPVATLCVGDFSHSKLCELYENDFIFDKFECNWSGDGKYVITGSYENYYYLFDWKQNKGMLIDGSKTTKIYSKFYDTNKQNENSNNIFETNNKLTYDSDNVDFSKKIFNISWNQYEPFIAVAATNILYLYNGKNDQKK